MCVSPTNCKFPLYVYDRLISPFTAITKEHTKEHTIQIDIFTLLASIRMPVCVLLKAFE